MRKSIWVILFAFILGFNVPAHATADSVFTVKGVNVDITADSAAIARDRAFLQAQVQAFTVLIDRILSEEDQLYFQLPDNETISTLVKDYEITEEKLSNVRYIGTYTFRFKDKDVKDFLQLAGNHYTDVGSKPVLVIPFYQSVTGTILWRAYNPWLAAWSRSEGHQGLVPFIVPIGDLDDVSEIGDNGLLTYNAEEMKSMVARYDAGEATFLTAIPQWTGSGFGNQTTPDYIDIHIYSTAGVYPRLASTLKVMTELGDTPEMVYDRAVLSVKNTFQQRWKDRTMIAPGQGNGLTARVQFASMAEWVDTQKALRKVQGLSEVKLLSLSPNEASVEIEFQGTAQRLRLALAQADMTLSQPSLVFVPYMSDSSSNPYGRRSSPLIYDLFLNKYRH